MSNRATAALFGVGLIWGASFLFIKVALDDGLRALDIVVVRTLAGALVLHLVVRVQRRELPLAWKLAPAVLAMSLLGTILPFLLITWAQGRLDSGPVSVLNATMPIFAALFAAAFLPEDKLTWRTIAGVLIGLAGAGVLTGTGVLDIGDSSAVAQLAVIGASAAYAASAIIVRMTVKSYDTIALSAVNMTVAAVVVLAIALAFQPPRLEGSTEAWASMLALGILGTGVAYVLYYWLIRESGSVRASLVTYIIPVVGVTLGAIVLDEPLRWNTLAGGMIIVLGIAVGSGMYERVAAIAKPRRAPVHS